MAHTAPLSGLTAAITLPPGVAANIYDAQLEEDFREQDSESFDDAGYGAGVLTGLRLRGSVLGWLTGDDPGLAVMHAAVPIVFTAAAGCLISGNFNITRFHVRLRVGRVSVFTAEVASVGAYTKTWLNS